MQGIEKEILYWAIAAVAVFFTLRILRSLFPKPNKKAGYVTNGAPILPGQYRY